MGSTGRCPCAGGKIVSVHGRPGVVSSRRSSSRRDNKFRGTQGRQGRGTAVVFGFPPPPPYRAPPGGADPRGAGGGRPGWRGRSPTGERPARWGEPPTSLCGGHPPP